VPDFVDSTALIALGELRLLKVLQHLSTPIVITPTIQLEVRNSSSQVSEAISAGWMVVESPDTESVEKLLLASRLDEGEASLIAVADRLSGRNADLLVDEGRAFSYLQRKGMINSFCLAQALHQLEEAGFLPSCKATMDQLVNEGHYSWAKPVKAFYMQWCSNTGRISVFEQGHQTNQVNY
jgi:predicted nucleic acid-binding protein